MLLQKTGVNHGQGGALRCCAWLDAVFPEAYTAEEKEWVMRRYQQKAQCLLCLLHFGEKKKKSSFFR
jgi:hypothetical protein